MLQVGLQLRLYVFCVFDYQLCMIRRTPPVVLFYMVVLHTVHMYSTTILKGGGRFPLPGHTSLSLKIARHC